MQHDTALLATLAIGLASALVGGYLAARAHLPHVVGFLLAGVAVGPFTPGVLADPRIASQLAEIGVVLLMFDVGMHLSLRDLWATRGIALTGALAQIVIATLLGAGLARWWGWSWAAGVVFGLALSVASTVVLLRALEARGAVDTQDGRIAVGWLIVEDFAMVLAVVMLPALAAWLGGAGSGLASSGAAAGLASQAAAPALALSPLRLLRDLAVTFGKVAAFVGLMLVVGARLVPWLLRHIERTGSRELFTVAVVAVALGVAYGSAALFGVSIALGAFFGGVAVQRSALSGRAAAGLQPLQDAFSVLFFVGVGMVFNPAILLHAPLRVLAVLLVIVVGKSLAAFLIVRALRRPKATALLISASLAQIGEFSFILAGLGVTLGLLRGEARDLIVAGAVLSIVLNPLVFHATGVGLRARQPT